MFLELFNIFYCLLFIFFNFNLLVDWLIYCTSSNFSDLFPMQGIQVKNFDIKIENCKLCK